MALRRLSEKTGQARCACPVFFHSENPLLFFLGSGLFRSLERVYLGVEALEFDLFVGRKITQAAGPFLNGRRIGRTDLADFAVDNPVAALTFFDDGLTGISFKDATALGPEGTLSAGENGFTFHLILPPLCYNCSFSSKAGIIMPVEKFCQLENPRSDILRQA